MISSINHWLQLKQNERLASKEQQQVINERVEKELEKEEEQDMSEPDYAEEKIVLGQEIVRVPEKLLSSVAYRSIVAIKFTNRLKQLQVGTGVLLSRDIVMTSAHNIYDKRKNEEYSNYKIYVSPNGTASSYYEVQGKIYPPQFKTCRNNERLMHDYAIIKIKQVPNHPIQFEEYLPLTAPCYICLLNNNQDIHLQISGYPPNCGNNFQNLDVQAGKRFRINQYGQSGKDKIVGIDFLARRIEYAISTLPGQSGAPVISNGEIIAIHNGGAVGTEEFNIGRLFTYETLQEISLWIKHLGGDPIAIHNPHECHHPEGVTIMQRCEAALEAVQLSQYVNLVELHLPNNMLAAIDTGLLSYLTYLLLSDNQLSSIDLSQNKQLTYLNVANNQLRSITLSNPNLAYLYLNNNSLTEINLSKCQSLGELYISDNKLSEIDLSDNQGMTRLDINYNKLLQIDLSTNPSLQRLHIDNNKLKDIDLSANPYLDKAYLYENQLQLVILYFKADLNDEEDYYSTFIAHQKARVCEVQLLTVESDRKAADSLIQGLRKTYDGTINNKYKCRYSFEKRGIPF